MFKIDPEQLASRLQAAVQGEFEIGRLLGQGGFAAVFLARDLMLGREVAIKVLDPTLALSGEHSDRFLNEARLVAALEHPHIVPVYKVEQKGGLLYIVMRFIPGTSLAGLLTRDGRVPPARAASLAREVADALDYAHRHKVIHRDIKPDNILLDASGHAVVTDFGIARAAQAARLTQEGMVVGTPAYMSPEQASGEEVDGRSDVYALGSVLYEMLAGRPPFGGRTAAQVLAKHLSQKPPDLESAAPDTPAALAGIVETALAKDPQDRFPTAAAMAEALGVAATPVGLETSAARRRRRVGRRLRWAGGLMLVVLLLVIAFAVGAVTLLRSLFLSESPAISLVAPNVPAPLASAAQEKLGIPVSDTVLYLFVAHGRPSTDGLVVTSTEMIRVDSAGTRRYPRLDLGVDLNSKGGLLRQVGSMVVRPKGGTADTLFTDLTPRELAAIYEALQALEPKGSGAPTTNPGP